MFETLADNAFQTDIAPSTATNYIAMPATDTILTISLARMNALTTTVRFFGWRERQS